MPDESSAGSIWSSGLMRSSAIDPVRVLMEACAAEWQRLAAWHADLAEKYRHAAQRPWETLPLGPRPPLHSVPLAERFPREAEELQRLERGQ